MSADPKPFSSSSVEPRKITAGKTYKTTSGRRLMVTKATEHMVKYVDEADPNGVELSTNRRTFLAAIRSADG